MIRKCMPLCGNVKMWFKFLIFVSLALYCCLPMNNIEETQFKIQDYFKQNSRKLLPSTPRDVPVKCIGQNTFIPNNYKELRHDVPPNVPIYYPVDQPNFCSDYPDLEIIAYVVSTIAAMERRSVTRQTWGSSYEHDINLKVVFFVGKPKDDIEESILAEESTRYNDIVQGNFTDEYHLVTYKVLSAMYWVSSRCPSVPWVIRADDDILVDPWKVKALLPMASESGFNCHVWENPPVLRSGIWKVSKQHWRSKHYPSFCAGAFVFHHQKLINQLLEASCRTALKVWMEDVYVFGVLAEKAGGMKTELKIMEHKHRGGGIEDADFGKITSWAEIQNTIYWWTKITFFHQYSSSIDITRNTTNVMKL